MIRIAFATVLLLAVSATRLAAEEFPERVPEVWTIVIGIDDYEDRAIPDCTGAVFDAHAIGRFFRESARWGADHVLFMSDSGNLRHGRPEDPVTNLRPTKENLDWAITKWLDHRLKPNDLVLIYFAGHAVGLPPRPESRPWAALARLPLADRRARAGPGPARLAARRVSRSRGLEKPE